MAKVSLHRRVHAIWVSDVHLGTRGSQAKYLLEFLKSYRCEKIYLVGDIIDGWNLKKGIYWPQSHTNVIRYLLTLSKKGVEVVYVTGNHDEFLRKYSESEFGNIRLTDEVIHKTRDGRQLLVIHGDEYDVVVRYNRWIAVLGDKAYITLLIINRWFNALREKMGYPYWSLSAYLKHKVKTAVSFIGAYEEALAQECVKRNIDGVVCGHIHHAEIKEINSKMYYNCGDWVESCTGLVEDFSGNISLINWVEDRETVLEAKVEQEAIAS